MNIPSIPSVNARYPFFAVLVTIRRLYLYLSSNNHDSLESTINTIIRHKDVQSILLGAIPVGIGPGMG